MLKKLGKLLKYEFIFYSRLLPSFYLILLLLALPAGYQVSQSGFSQPLFTFLWAIIITALTVVNIVLIVQRFTDNFYKNPGSLMFTLPVTNWTLVASKAIAALSAVVASVLVIIISALVYAMATRDIAISSINFSVSPIQITLLALVFIIMVFQQICLLYTAIGVSQILGRFRFAAKIAVYFGIMYFVEQPVFRLIGSLQGSRGLFTSSIATTQGLISTCLGGLVFAALFFVTTGLLLKRTLNLE